MKINKRKAFLWLRITWPIIAMYITLWLYNIWFDTWDKIKYDTTYSPEFDQDKGLENIIYWVFIIIAIVVEIWLIKFYRKNKKLAVGHVPLGMLK